MRQVVIALLATTAFAMAVPAVAHEEPLAAYGTQDDWNNGGDTYAEFDLEYRHIWDGIQHGLSDESYTPAQARRFFRAMQRIRARADWMNRSGYYDPVDIQDRLERLHDTMHVAHERGHEEQDRYLGYGYGFGR